MPLLDESDINSEIENLPEWNYIEKTITKDYSFDRYTPLLKKIELLEFSIMVHVNPPNLC